MSLQAMVAHSQFCMSGDMTLESTEQAITDLSRIQHSTGRWVFTVSDANLRRYGIAPATLGAVLNSDPSVQAVAVFIAGLGDEAGRLVEGLPSGKGYVCLDTGELPALFKKLLSTRFGV